MSPFECNFGTEFKFFYFVACFDCFKTLSLWRTMCFYQIIWVFQRHMRSHPGFPLFKKISHNKKTVKTFFSVLFPFRLRLSRENFTFVLFFFSFSFKNQIAPVKNIRNSINFARNKSKLYVYSFSSFDFSCRRRFFLVWIVHFPVLWSN